jgi:hypothetical protein
MCLDASWPGTATEYLNQHPNVAVATGHLVETNPGLWSRVLELDWKHEVGAVEACGGAALFRREAFEVAGGFPIDVRYGEEPLLCWRIRNEQGFEVHHLDAAMAHHDLGLNGFGAYWRQYVRNGESYGEIADRCEDTDDPMWSRERQSNTVWAIAILLLLFTIIAAPMPIRLAVIILTLAVLLRKTVQTCRKGRSLSVAAMYAFHTYFCKLPLAYGQLRFRLRAKA